MPFPPALATYEDPYRDDVVYVSLPFEGGISTPAVYVSADGFEQGAPAYGGSSFNAVYYLTSFDDWYNHIHYINTNFDFGAITGDLSRQFKVWNAYLVPQTLENIAGLQSWLNIEPATPVDFARIEQRTFLLTIQGSEAPAAFEVDLDFQWSIAPDHTLTVTGQAVVVLPYLQHVGLEERLSWKTWSMFGQRGTRQAAMLRATPVQTYDVTFAMQEFSSSQHLIRDWYGRRVAVPFMSEGETAQVNPTDTEVFVDTTRGDWREFALLWKSDTEYRLFTIVDVFPDRIVLPAATNMSGFISVFPAASATMRSPQRTTYGEPQYDELSMEIRFTDSRDLADDGTYLMHKGLEVLLTAPTAVPVDDQFDRRIGIVDTELSTPMEDIYWERAVASRPMRWFVDRDGLWPLRLFLHRHKGSQVPFYQPTFEHDFQKAGASATQISASLIVAADTTYLTHGAATDVALLLTNGNYVLSGVNGVNDNGDGTMTLLLDSLLPQTYADIARISMMFKRVLSDDVTIVWRSQEYAEVNTATGELL